MHVLISGASGLVGSALTRSLTAGGHRVRRLERRRPLRDDDLSGPVNAVAPQPVTNRELTRVLGGVLRRPTLVPMPAPLVRLVFGEMGEELLLAGARVAPARLEETDFTFRFSDLETALRYEVGGAGA